MMKTEVKPSRDLMIAFAVFVLCLIISFLKTPSAEVIFTSL